MDKKLGSLTKREEKEITPLVKSLSGVIYIDDELDVQDEYVQYLIEKYK